MNRATETRLRKLETVIDPKDRPSLFIVACDQAEADCKLAEARKAGLEGEPTIVLTGVRCADQLGWLLAHIAEHGRKIYDPRPT
jgi:hypothetical protein